MQQILAGECIEWLKEPSGECETVKLFPILNKIRERMYQMYSDIQLFEVIECFEVQDFCVDCLTCGEVYQGVTLPRDYQTVEALWFNDLPAELFSSWREWQAGVSHPCSCGLSKYDMPGTFSSERDILPVNPQRLKVIANKPADFGKQVTIRGRDDEGVARTEVLTLAATPQITNFTYASLARGNGFIKPRTAGTVMLSDEDDRILSIYAPDETIPGYKRIKITGLRQCDGRVNIRASRRYFPVYRESDVVETDNRTAFEEMARFLRLNEKTNKDGNDLRSAAMHLAQAQAALMGAKSRDIGKTTKSELRVVSPSFSCRRLGSW